MLVHGFVGCCTWATFLLSICLEEDLGAFDGYFLLFAAAISCCTSCVTLSLNQRSCCSFMSITVCGKGLVTLWSRTACRRSTSMQSGGDSEASWLHPVKLWRNTVECSYLISRSNHYFLLLKLLNSSPATGRKASRALSKENVSSIRITDFGSASAKLRRSWRRVSCSFIIYRTSLWKSAAISW